MEVLVRPLARWRRFLCRPDTRIIEYLRPRGRHGRRHADAVLVGFLPRLLGHRRRQVRAWRPGAVADGDPPATNGTRTDREEQRSIGKKTAWMIRSAPRACKELAEQPAALSYGMGENTYQPLCVHLSAVTPFLYFVSCVVREE